MQQIAEAVTSSLQRRSVGPSEKVIGHYRPVSVRDIWAWIAQRFFLSLEKRRTLRDHINSVGLQIFVDVSHRHSSSSCRRARHGGGFLTTAIA